MKLSDLFHVAKTGVIKRNPQKIRGLKVKIKSRSVMGDYIALHGLVPLNELPLSLRGKIPKDELWVREDHKLDSNLYLHENNELFLMQEYGYTYKHAHNVAQTMTLWC